MWSNGHGSSEVAQMVKNLFAMQETHVWSLGRGDSWKEEMATHSSIPAWKIPCTEQPGGLLSVGSQRVGHDWAAVPSPPPMDTLFPFAKKSRTLPSEKSESPGIGKTPCREKTWLKDPLIKKEKATRQIVHKRQLHHSMKSRLPSLFDTYLFQLISIRQNKCQWVCRHSLPRQLVWDHWTWYLHITISTTGRPWISPSSSRCHWVEVMWRKPLN